jgi:hypothetical protein
MMVSPELVSILYVIEPMIADVLCVESFRFVNCLFTASFHSWTQSRLSARLFLQSSELGPRTPSPADDCVPPPWSGGGGTHSFAGEGVEESRFGRRAGNVVL